MKARPTVNPAVIAQVIEKAPNRVRRKVDKTPQVANDWDWSCDGDDWKVQVGEQTVGLRTVDGHIQTMDDVKCDCLLSPRCYHILACLSILEPAQPGSDETDTEEAPGEIQPNATPSAPADLPTLLPSMLAAAQAIWNASADILVAGARSAGSLLQSKMLRAIHECRSVGLHRLANAGIRVVTNTRQLRDNSPAFSTDRLTDDLGELMDVSWQLQMLERPRQDLIGVARRRYQPVGSLRVWGLFSEPVLTTSGYSGVVTYACDDDGCILSVANVRPGDANRVKRTWRAGIDVGNVSLSHRDLSHQGLLLQSATQSMDGRLGGGKDCRAVPSAENSWDEEPISRLFAKSLADQVARAFDLAESCDPAYFPAGGDFLFLRGTLCGTDGEALILRTLDNAEVIRLTIQQDSERLAFRENLTLLACAVGLRVKCIARIIPNQAGTGALLAVAPDNQQVTEPDKAQEPAKFQLPEKWSGRVSVGMDQLQRRHLKSALASPLVIAPSSGESPNDGLQPLRRRVQALAIGGRHSLPPASSAAMRRESKRFLTQLQPTAASLMRFLLQAATSADHDLSGVRFPADGLLLARHWLGCYVYERAAQQAFQKGVWLRH